MRSWPLRIGVLDQAHVRHRAVAQPLLRHEGEPPARGAPRSASSGRPACRRCGWLRWRHQASPDSASQQFVLAVAGDAGDAEDLAGRGPRSCDVLAGRCRARSLIAFAATPRRPKPHLAGRRAVARRSGDFSSSPIIIWAKLGRLSASGSQVGRPPCRRAGSSPCRRAPDLLQLVADVEDRAALGGQAAQGLEQPLDLLRRQHRGRLVHDQQRGILQQAADDLDALARPPRPARERRRSPACPCPGRRSPAPSWPRRAQCWNTMPMPSALAARGSATVTSCRPRSAGTCMPP